MISEIKCFIAMQSIWMFFKFIKVFSFEVLSFYHSAHSKRLETKLLLKK